MGRGISTPHYHGANVGKIRRIPTIGLDYCYPDGYKKDDEGAGLTILVCRQFESGATLCMRVPRKGTAFEGVVAKVLEWIGEMGYQEIILKCDKESSAVQVQNAIMEKRKDLVEIQSKRLKRIFRVLKINATI